MTTSTCVHCSTAFEAPRRRRYCSRSCQERWLYANSARFREQKLATNKASRIRGHSPTAYERTCPVCQQRFTARRRDRMYCSTRCKAAGLNARRRADGRLALRHAVMRESAAAGVAVPPHEIYARDAWRCQLCAAPIDPQLRWPHPGAASLDHIVPLNAGGTHDRDNLQAAHLICNQRKRNSLA